MDRNQQSFEVADFVSGYVLSAHLQKLGGKKLAFARRQILQQSSTLIVHLYLSSTLSFCTFLKKYQKQGSRVRHSVLKS